MTGELITNIAGTAPALIEHGIALRRAWINRNGFLHAYRFEVGLNLDIIAAVKRGSLASVSVGSPAFAALVGSFETGIGLALLAGHDRRDYRRLMKLLKKYWKPARASYTDDEPDSAAESPEGILGAVSFSVRKMEALKRIVRIAEHEPPFFPAFNLKKRLENINDSLLDIANCLKAVMPLIE